MRVPVDGKVVREVDLLKWRPLFWRLNVWPFAVIYGMWVLLATPNLEFTDATIVLGTLIVLHILSFLFTAWSVDFRCFVQAIKVSPSLLTV